MKYLDKDYKKKFIDNDEIYRENVYEPDKAEVDWYDTLREEYMIPLERKKEEVLVEDVSVYAEGKSIAETALFRGKHEHAKDILLEQRAGEFEEMCDDLLFAITEDCMEEVINNYNLIRGYMDDCYALQLMEAEDPFIKNSIKYFEHIIESLNDTSVITDWKTDKFIIENCIKNDKDLDAIKDKFCPPSSKGCQKAVEATAVPGCVGTQQFDGGVQRSDGLKKDVEKSNVEKNVLLEPDKQLISVEDRSLDEDPWEWDI